MKNLSTTLILLFFWLLIPFSLSAVGDKRQHTKPQVTVENSKEITVKKKKNRKAKRSPITEEEKIARDKMRAAIRSVIFGTLGFTVFLAPFAFVGLANAVRVHRWIKKQEDPSKYKLMRRFAIIGKILCGFIVALTTIAFVGFVTYLAINLPQIYGR